MLFNSIEFAFFLLIVFLLYWFVFQKSLKAQNLFLLLASYFFYGWWDWRFLGLIFISSLSDYLIGAAIGRTESNKKRKQLLYLSLLINLGILCVFKYFNFFSESFYLAFQTLGIGIRPFTLNVLLPVGISFYTFQTLSYTIDIYRKEIKPSVDAIAFFAFVGFFPQLVAGPIERTKNLYPQFLTPRRFNYESAVNGSRQILWGLFKKMVIADHLAIYVNQIFEQYEALPASILLLGAVYFSIQIYCDFSGYSDIAIGTARLFGFNLLQNFNFPYYSQNMTEFWRKWHISLSTWIRDYLYTPLALYFRDYQKTGIIVALVLSFSINGLWHGAAWTFIIWGLIHGLALSFEIMTKKQRKQLKKKINLDFYRFCSIGLTFVFWSFTLIIFRAESLSHAAGYISSIFFWDIFTTPDYHKIRPLVFVFFILVFEHTQRNTKYALEIDRLIPWKAMRIGLYYAIIFATFYLAGKQQSFIYFQF